MFNKWLFCASVFIFCPAYLLAHKFQEVNEIDEYIPCDKGWSFFGDKCYKMFGGNMQAFGRLNWHEAAKRCESIGGHLATVGSQEAQDFIFTFLSLTGEMEAWIGLNDLKNETQYEWPDGTPFNYSKWNVGEPSGHAQGNEDCVQMALWVFRGEVGNWIDLDCGYPLAYICQKEKDEDERTPNPILCSTEDGGGWKYGDSCFNVVKESMTWDDAEKYCQDKFNGHLSSMLNFKMEYFLNYIMGDFRTDIWLGVKIKDQLQQMFTSGWYVVYTNEFKIPHPFRENTCVVRRKGKRWEVVPCGQEHPFVCETSKVRPPDFEIPLEESKCPELPQDWRDLGGEYCYYLDTSSRVNWYQANFECNRRGGALASFHSQKDIDVLTPYVKNALMINHGIFIGHCRRLGGYENEFVWADGSKMDFKYWNDGEPSSTEEQCGELFPATMKWNDVRCSETKGFICSVKKASTKFIEVAQADPCISGITLENLIGITAGILLMVIILSFVIYYFGPLLWRDTEKKSAIGVPKHQKGIQPTLQQVGKFDGRAGHIIINDYEEDYEYMD